MNSFPLVVKSFKAENVNLVNLPASSVLVMWLRHYKIVVTFGSITYQDFNAPPHTLCLWLPLISASLNVIDINEKSAYQYQVDCSIAYVFLVWDRWSNRDVLA